MMDLHVARKGRSYVILDGREPVSGPYTSRPLALMAMDRKKAEAKAAEQGRTRACLCCSAAFWSTGNGHRMCDSCRARARGLDNNMLGV